MNGILRFEQEFTRVKPGHVFLLRYMRDAIGVPEVQWSDLTTLNLSKVRDFIAERVTPNSLFTYMAELKAFLARYADEGIIPCKNPAKELKARKEPSQHLALTEEEVLLWDSYTPKSECERDVKILFMRECLTGARQSDCRRLSMDNIKDGVLVYVSQKTRTEVKQPVHRLLPKYLEVQPGKHHNCGVVNETISRICKNLGIDEEVTLYVGGKLRKGPKYEFITSLSGRRSMVSNLALRNVPLPIISKIVGHTSTQTTNRYLCVGINDLGENALAFFNG